MTKPSYEDAVPVAAASTGSMITLANAQANACAGIRFATAGTFIGTTKRGTAVTFTGAAGEVLEISFTSKTGGTADVHVLL
jgi:hypothetical protein